jgi:hypothetical protein
MGATSKHAESSAYYKAQVQKCKTNFLFANEEHGRLKQMHDYKMRKNII